MNRILLVSAPFYPEISPRAFRATQLAKEFVRLGHEVTLVTKHRNSKMYAKLPILNKLSIVSIDKLRFPQIKINQKNLVCNKLARGIRRVFQLLFEYPDIELAFKVRKKLKFLSGYDLIISFAVPYPVHWGIAALSHKKIAKMWIADCGDPYFGDRTDSFKKLFYFAYVERWFMRKPDFITITNKNFRINYFKEFWSKLIEIPQGFDFDEIIIEKSKRENNFPIFAYSGVLMKYSRDPSLLLDHLITLEEDFLFIIYNEQPAFFEPYKDNLGGKLELRSYVPREILLNELAQCDFLINIGYDTEKQVPSKLIDYTLSGRPIFSMNSDEFNTKVFEEFLSGDYSNQFILPDFDRFNIRNVAARFLDLIGEK